MGAASCLVVVRTCCGSTGDGVAATAGVAAALAAAFAFVEADFFWDMMVRLRENACEQHSACAALGRAKPRCGSCGGKPSRSAREAVYNL